MHQEYLSVVLNEIDSINKVIQQLLDFSRPRQSQWQQVQLKALIEEALILVQTSGVQARIDFSTQFDAELPAIVGIDSDVQKKIFDPFFTTKASGTGLGLALSQRIINAHQGDIRVASQPGCGATFTLILPINPQETSSE